MTRRIITYFGLSGCIELGIIAALAAVLVATTGLNLFHYRFDADEPAHLHVIWSWTQGLVQYRDVFDNHMPLFHVMLAPVAALIGERPTILHWMRLVLLPAHLVSAWATYRIATDLFSRRVGVWSVLLVNFFPVYQRTSVEFRPDNVWSALCLLCLTVLVGGSITVRRMLVAGLLLGFCFAITMKSAILLIALGLSGAALWAIGRQRFVLSPSVVFGGVFVFLAAMVVLPLTILIFFAVKGVLPDLWSCVFAHQFLGHLFRPRQLLFGLASVLLFSLAIFAARRLVDSAEDVGAGVKRAFILLVCCTYIFVLKTFWPLVVRADYLPWSPLLFILVTGGVFALAGSMRAGDRVFALSATVVILELILLCLSRPFWQDKTREETNLLRDVLALTTPADFVFDCKGETVFRRRCFRPTLETITRKRIRRGMIPDDAPQRCIETRTCVVATGMKERFFSATRTFIEQNYLPVTENLSVAGVRLHQADGSAYNFKITIPAEYEIMAKDAPGSGTLDGADYKGARFLSAGDHTFISTSGPGELVVLWARAADRGYRPFILGTNTVR